MGRGRKPLEHKGVRITIFMHEEQLKWLDEQVSRAGTTRSKYIETCVFPCEMRTMEIRKGNYSNNGGKK